MYLAVHSVLRVAEVRVRRAERGEEGDEGFIRTNSVSEGGANINEEVRWIS